MTGRGEGITDSQLQLGFLYQNPHQLPQGTWEIPTTLPTPLNKKTYVLPACEICPFWEETGVLEVSCWSAPKGFGCKVLLEDWYLLVYKHIYRHNY